MTRFFWRYSFTLLEVLVSLVVLTTGIVFIFQFLFGSAAALRHIDNRIQARFQLSQKKWEAAAEIKSGSYLSQYESQVEGDNLFFQVKIRPERIFDFDNLYALNSEVFWQEGSRQRRIWEEDYIRGE